MAKGSKVSRSTVRVDGYGLNARGRRLMRQVPKDLKPWVRAATDLGWRIDHRGNHAVLIAPDGTYRVPIPSEANNALRTVFRNQLRDHGVPID